MIRGQGQNIRFGGVGDAHHNVVYYKSIKTVTYTAHTMMIHTDMRIPSGFTITDIWTMVMDYTCWIYNRMPMESTGFSP